MARAIAEIVLQDSAGSVRPSKTLTFYEENGTTPLAQSVYAAESGGSPLVSPAVDSLGTGRFYVDTPQRAQVAASDFPATKYPIVFEADPDTVVYDGRSAATSLSGLLTLSGGLALSRNSTSPALTVQNSHATGPGFQVKNNAGTTILEHTRTVDPLLGLVTMDVVSFRNGAKINYDYPNNGMLFDNRNLQWIHADATPTRVMWFLEHDNSYVQGGSPTAGDVEPLGVYSKQMAGTDAYNRAIEVGMISLPSTSTLPKFGIEISTQANHLGNGRNYTACISMKNLGDAFNLSTPQPLDAFIVMGSDDYGADYFLMCRGIDVSNNDSGPIRFSVTGAGAVNHASHIVPIADATANLGSGSLRYGFLYTYNILTSDGLASAPPYAFQAAGGTGMYHVNPGIGFAVAGTSRAVLTASGLTVNSKTIKGGGQTDFSASLSGNTSSASYATITNGERTLTTIGGDLLVSVNLCAANSSAGNASYLALALDGAAEVGEVVYTATVNNGQFIMTLVNYRFTGVSAASHTVRARWKASAGTTTIYSGQMTMQELPS